MRIDVWSDIVCPFCLVGKRELAQALDRFPHADAVEVVPRSFELAPGRAIDDGQPVIDHLMSKYDISRAQAEANSRQLATRADAVGLTFNWERAWSTSTFDAHRVVHLAATEGGANAVETALMRAYFSDGQRVDDHAVIRAAAVGEGLDATRVDEVLAGDDFADAVRADQAAAQARGIASVPTFVFDDRWAVTGAQDAALFADVLTQVWEATREA